MASVFVRLPRLACRQTGYVDVFVAQNSIFDGVEGPEQQVADQAPEPVRQASRLDEVWVADSAAG